MLTASRLQGNFLKRSATVWVCCLAVALVSSVTHGEDASVRAFHDQFFQAWNNADLDGLVDALSEDTVYHPANGTTIRGREALVQVYGQFLKDYRVEMVVTPELLEATGDHGTMMGLYQSTLTPKDGGASIIRGGRYYMALLRAPGGEWRIVRELTQATADNDSLPESTLR